MSGISIEGFSYSGKLQDLNDDAYDHLEKRFATVVPITSNRAALDVVSMGYFRVGLEDRVVEAGSDDKQIVLTGHDAKKGDIIRLKTTANTIEELEIVVRKVVDANTIELEGVLSDVLTAADTFDILRPIAQRYDETGASLASVVSPPLQFAKDGLTVAVTEDTVTPANNIPLPVKLVDVTGDINITAGDLNVQLSHSGGTPDSVQIGNGTNIVDINASNEMLVKDTDATVILGNLLTELALKADLTETQPVSVSSLALPTGAATEATLASLEAKDFATQTTLAALLAAFSAEDFATQTTLAALLAAFSAEDFATQTTLAALAAEDFATETTLAAMSAKLPAALGQLVKAASMSVTIASDQDDLGVAVSGKTVIDFLRNDYTGTNVTTGAFVELKAAIAQDCTAIEIFDSSGQTLELATGSGGSEVVFMRVFPGGNALIPVALAAATRIAVRAVSADATVGEININFYQ